MQKINLLGIWLVLMGFSFLPIMETKALGSSSNSRASYWKTWKQKYDLRQKIKSKNYFFNSNRSARKYKSNSPSQNSGNLLQSNVVANIKKIRSKRITNLSSDSVSVFQLGFSLPQIYGNRALPKSYLIDTISFELNDEIQSYLDRSVFSLEVVRESDDSVMDFEFDENGKLTLKLNNARISAGDNLVFDLNFKIRDLEAYEVGKPLSMHLKLADIQALDEFDQTPVALRIRGNRVSEKIEIAALSSVAASGGVNLQNIQIDGGLVNAGEKTMVLQLNMGASLEDLSLESLRVRNIYGNNIDSFVEQVNLIHLATGEKIKSVKFLNGAAQFKLSGSEIKILRGSQVHLGIEIVVKSDIRAAVDTRFKFDVTASDVVVFGLGGNRYISTSDKIISIEAREFFMSTGGKTRIFVSENQPTLQSIGSPVSAYAFKVQNAGDRDISIGRLAFNLQASGVDFVNGFTAADFALAPFVQGRSRAGLFSVTSVSGGNKVVFDANSEFYISANSTQEFVLYVALEDILNGDSQNDGLSVQILGDTNYAKNTLSTLQLTNSNFIWSDHSGRPHTSFSQDWYSGYLFPGLSTNSKVIRR